MIQDLGGEDSISTQQRTMVELASTSKLLLGSIDALLLSQPSLFTRNKTVLPVIQRQQLADGLARYLNQLVLEHWHKVKTLHEILTNHDEKLGNGNGVADGASNGDT
ncbi:MAG: hypothetical protein ABW172_03415 [Candidatus Binatia bacterium]